MKKILFLVFAIFIGLVLISFFSDKKEDYPVVDRESKIPQDAVKMMPEKDSLPPKLHSSEYQKPVPMPGPVNSAGAEDSPFMAVDRNEFYFFFTPDVRVPVEKQVIDGVTGVYVSKKIGGQWQKPERVFLQDPGKLALDGCEFVQDDKIWVCSAREGYTGIHWVSADYKDDKWTNWEVTDFNPDYKVGELHFSVDWNEVYFHSDRIGGKGSNDIWMSKKAGGDWQEPINISAINSTESDGWPYLSPDSNELWFTRFYLGSPAIFRSKKVDGQWQKPELIISQFAGEPTLDKEGNVYFTHHYYKDGKMIEADIYVAYRKNAR